MCSRQAFIGPFIVPVKRGHGAGAIAFGDQDLVRAVIQVLVWKRAEEVERLVTSLLSGAVSSLGTAWGLFRYMGAGDAGDQRLATIVRLM